MTDGAGILMVGLALTVGFLCWWRGHGKGKRFWFGFELAGLAAVVAYVATINLSEGLMIQWPFYLLQLGAVYVPYVMELVESLEGSPAVIREILLFEVSYGLPMLLIASLGGILTALLASLPKVERSATPLK
jgi:hypothetical protein